MADLLIREVPDEIVASIDVNAKRLDLSRSEYLRCELARAAARSAVSVTAGHLVRFAEAFSDLADLEVMRRAWE